MDEQKVSLKNEIKEGIYRHYKGNLYRMICVSRHSETLEELVVYQGVTNGNRCWVRPATMWVQEVEVEGNLQPRFRYLAANLDELDEKPIFELIEAIKANMEQYHRLRECDPARFYHKLQEGMLEDNKYFEDVEGESAFARAREKNADEVFEYHDNDLRLPYDDLTLYNEMERFVSELPAPQQNVLMPVIYKGEQRHFEEEAERIGVLEHWQRYLVAVYRRVAREWCDANDIVWWMDLIEQGTQISQND